MKERKCRDVLCLLLFLVFWGGMFVICGFAVKNGTLRPEQATGTWLTGTHWLLRFLTTYPRYAHRVPGNTARLVYGTDSFGFTCGATVTFQGATLDLTSRKNLYYLNPLDLMSIYNIPFAKSVCLDGCPSAPNVCDYKNLPCNSGTQYQ